MPPNINYSYKKFTVEDGKIRFGMKAVKNVGNNLIDTLVKVRERDGAFKSLTDFVTRINKEDSSVLNKRAVESLIRCGAMDDFEGNRAQYLAIYEKTLASSSNRVKNNVAGQFLLLRVPSKFSLYFSKISFVFIVVDFSIISRYGSRGCPDT